MSTGRTLLPAALVALLQIGFLGWMIAGRAAVLRDGREVVLKVEPVDPRDLLRGDYVRLGYEIAQIPVGLVANIPPVPASSGKAPIFVRLAPGADGTWNVTRASFDTPLEPPPASGEVDIRGEVNLRSIAQSDGAVVRPTYGIERFYLPEGEGRRIEQDMRERPFFVKIAVGRDGAAQIKQFLDGDTPLYTEPFY
ncbi:MAG: GDYXXLXY domain-containing protein [Rhizobiaceae bacterium]|nr:GDYXXLXY domain-containing protein [Rhizobiaceae bacterium]